MGIPLAEVASPYHQLALSRSAGVYEIALVGGVSEMDRDFVLTWRPVADAVPSAALFTEKVGADHYGLLMVLPPAPHRAAQPSPATRPRWGARPPTRRRCRPSPNT